MKWKPGYRFNPTDQEIVNHYLKLKMQGEDTVVGKAINEIRIYQYEPSDLPALAKMPSKHRVWHFFAQLDGKINKRGRTIKRTTKDGYWKATGQDRDIKFKGEKIGRKKTLVFHQGRTPNGKRTDWVMHEYHPSFVPPHQKPYVVCKVKNDNKQSKPIESRDGGDCEVSDITLENLLQIDPQIQGTAESSSGCQTVDIESMTWFEIYQLTLPQSVCDYFGCEGSRSFSLDQSL